MTPTDRPDRLGPGIASAITAFLLWGFSALYYRAVGLAPATEILAHRVVWSLLFTLLLVVLAGRLRSLVRLLGEPRLMTTLALSALLVSVNWWIFIWAVNNDRALEASMGYYIMPLVMVLLGRLFLAEQLTPGRWLAIGLVAAGVLNMLFLVGRVPWIALALAFSFGCYGLVRKQAPVDALLGLTVECLLLTPAALLYLAVLAFDGSLVFGTLGRRFDLLLAASALMTALPLLFFTYATKQLRFGTVGLLQYINPSCQFLLAVLLFDEPFTRAHLVTFACIWVGVLVFSLDGRLRPRRV